MNKIRCQRCTKASREKKGCPTCGGYGHVFTKARCTGCDRHLWVRPGVYTSHIGKEWYSVDGLKMTDTMDGSYCAKCTAPKDGGSRGGRVAKK